MRLVSTVFIALVMAGVSWGALTWIGDGIKPFSEGWWPAFQASVEDFVNFGESTAKEKLPDPATLPLPDLSGVPEIGEMGGDLTELEHVPDLQPINPGADGHMLEIPAG